MSPRQSRRAAREAQALSELQAEELVAEESEDDEGQTVPAQTSAFAALAVDDGDDEANSEPEAHISQPNSPKKKKKRRKAKALGATEETTQPTPAVTKAPPEPKPDKVAPLDEIDAALRDLRAKYAATSRAADASGAVDRFSASPSTSALRSVLGVETRYLDADAELKRMFGAKIVNAAANQPARKGAAAQNAHHRAGRLRSALAKPTSYWPPIQLVKSGLTMEPVEMQRGTGEVGHTFEHSRAYKEAQSQFLQAVASHDPNSLYALLAVQPYHIDSLLQLSEIQSHQGDQGQAEDFLDRALYALERAFSPSFQLTSGCARLAFWRVESRALFRACERKVSSLMRRGCWRTAFEFAKLLLSLSPYDDPYGALLFLDFLAPKTKQARFLQDLVQALSSAAPANGEQVPQYRAFPGLAFGHALALFEGEGAGNHEESSVVLVQAVLRFPAMVLSLYDKLDLSYPPSFSSLPCAQLPAGASGPAPLTHTLIQLYVHRSESLWKPPEVKAWLQEAVKKAEPDLEDSSSWETALGWDSMKPGGAHEPIAHGIARHILATDIPSIKMLLPSWALNSQSFTYDLLPPKQDPRATFCASLPPLRVSIATKYAERQKDNDSYFSAIGGRMAQNMRNTFGDLNVRRLVEALRANAQDPVDGNLDGLQALIAQLTEMQNANTMPGGLDEGAEDTQLPAAFHDDDDRTVAERNEAWGLRQAHEALWEWWGRMVGRNHETEDSEEE